MNLRAPIRARSRMAHWHGDVLIEFRQYHTTGATAVVFTDPESGQRVATATVNVDDPIEPDEIAVKDYSENEGVRATLEAAGLIGPEPVAVMRLSFVVIPIFKLLPEGAS